MKRLSAWFSSQSPRWYPQSVKRLGWRLQAGAAFIRGFLISVLQSFRVSFFMRHFYAARVVSPLISTAEADSRALANFCPLAVSV